MGNSSVWKYPLQVTDRQVARMPVGARLLCVQMQQGTPNIWAEVLPGADTEPWTITTAGTGHPLPEDRGDYLGSYQMAGGSLVFHVFAKGGQGVSS